MGDLKRKERSRWRIGRGRRREEVEGSWGYGSHGGCDENWG